WGRCRAPGPQDIIGAGTFPAGARFGLDVRSANHALGPHDDLVFGILAGQIASPNNPFVGHDLEFRGGGAGGFTPLRSRLPSPFSAAPSRGLASPPGDGAAGSTKMSRSWAPVRDPFQLGCAPLVPFLQQPIDDGARV